MATTGAADWIRADPASRRSVTTRTRPARAIEPQVKRMSVRPISGRPRRIAAIPADGADCQEQVVEALVEGHRADQVGVPLRLDVEPAPRRGLAEPDALEDEEEDVDHGGDAGGHEGDRVHVAPTRRRG